jgi:hypothetical protein
LRPGNRARRVNSEETENEDGVHEDGEVKEKNNKSNKNGCMDRSKWRKDSSDLRLTLDEFMEGK